jgi:glycosyltransferase involved in cell wall biosynthesis
MSEFYGIEILIDAFNIFHKQFPSVYLLLIGKCEDNLFNLYKSKVRKYQLEEYIIFTGKLTNTDIPQYLVTATALVLASPVSIRNSVSLPYKLGEYLAAKRPVIVTGVGAIPSILHDGIDAFIAEPGNPNSLCEKLIKCLSMTDEERSLMGKKGQEVAYQLFNSVYHSHRLQMFLEGLS